MKKKIFKQKRIVENLVSYSMYYQLYKSLQSNLNISYKIRLAIEFFKTPYFYTSLINFNRLHLICFISYRLKGIFKSINLSRLELNNMLFKNLIYGFIKY